MEEEFNNSLLQPVVMEYVTQLQTCIHLFEIREKDDEWIRFVDIFEGSFIGINQQTQEIALKTGGEEYHNLNSKKINQVIKVHLAKSQQLENVNTTTTKYQL